MSIFVETAHQTHNAHARVVIHDARKAISDAVQCDIILCV
jgi:hypothetical protein